MKDVEIRVDRYFRHMKQQMIREEERLNHSIEETRNEYLFLLSSVVYEDLMQVQSFLTRNGSNIDIGAGELYVYDIKCYRCEIDNCQFVRVLGGFESSLEDF